MDGACKLLRHVARYLEKNNDNPAENNREERKKTRCEALADTVSGPSAPVKYDGTRVSSPGVNDVALRQCSIANQVMGFCFITNVLV